jgi:RNA polymerase sigma-70 factor (ECF subfamily)
MRPAPNVARVVTLRFERPLRRYGMNAAQGAVTAVPPGTATAAATEQLVTEHYERRGRELWGLARRLGATEEQAADVVQDVHLRLWQELHKGTVLVDVDAWTFRVAYRLVMDQHRLGRRVQGLVGRLTAGRRDTFTHSLDDALSLWPLVDRLPERERATLYLRYRADLSFEQIGQVMGITTASARTYGSRGVERVRVLVRDAGEGSTR